MTNPYPLPREIRETDIIVGDGRATYGPFAFKIWDTVDVTVWVSRQNGDWAIESVTVVKVAAQPFDDFNATFAIALAAGDRAIVQSKRLHERLTSVTSGGAISSAALEAELSRQGTVIQELRRDINRALGLVPGLDNPPPLQAPEVGRALVGNALGTGFENGPTADQIANAQTYALAAEGFATGNADLALGAPYKDSRADLAAPNIPSATLRLALEGAFLDASSGWGIDYSGLVDSAPQVQNVMDASEGRLVVFPPGKILIGSTIDMNCNNFAQVRPDNYSKPAARMMGSGMYMTYFYSGVANGYAFRSWNGGEPFGGYFTTGVGGNLSDFGIRPAAGGIAGSSGIETSGLYQSDVRKISMMELTGNGIHMGGTGALDYDTQAWNEVAGNKIRVAGTGLLVSPADVNGLPASYIRVFNNSIEYCYTNVQLENVDQMVFMDNNFIYATTRNIWIRYRGFSNRNVYIYRTELGNNPAGNIAMVQIEALVNGGFGFNRMIRNDSDASAPATAYRIGPSGDPGVGEQPRVVRNVKFEQDQFIGGTDARPFYAFDFSPDYGGRAIKEKIRVDSPDWMQEGTAFTRYFPDKTNVAHLVDEGDYEDARALKALIAANTAASATKPVQTIAAAAAGTVTPLVDGTYSACRVDVSTIAAVVVSGTGVSSDGQIFDLIVRNLAGAAISVSIAGLYQQAGFVAPAAGYNKSAQFRYMSTAGAFIQIGPWSADFA